MLAMYVSALQPMAQPDNGDDGAGVVTVIAAPHATASAVSYRQRHGIHPGEISAAKITLSVAALYLKMASLLRLTRCGAFRFARSAALHQRRFPYFYP
jgi:hypothetical protein